MARQPSPVQGVLPLLDPLLGCPAPTRIGAGPEPIKPGFPILAVFRLKGQPKRDGSIIVRSCKATQSPVYPFLFSRIERATVMTALELRNVAVKVLAAERGIEPRR